MKEVKEVVDTVSVALANGQPEEAGNVVMQEVNHALLSMGVEEQKCAKRNLRFLYTHVCHAWWQDYSAYRG